MIYNEDKMNQVQDESIDFDIGAPQSYRLREVVIINLLGLVPGIVAGWFLGATIIGFLILIIQLFLIIANDSFVFSVLSFALLSMLGSVGIYYFTPLWVGANFYVKLIVKRMNLPKTSDGFVFQLATDPRLFRGVRGFLEDADDIGVLSLQEKALSFKGDCTNLHIPYSRIESIQKLGACDVLK